MHSRHVHSGSPDSLADELLAGAADREEHGKDERAIVAREAAERLLAGEQSVTAERAERVVGENGRYTVREGTRGEVTAELDDSAHGWAHQGKPELAQAAADAARAIEAGESSARVGHIEYVVKDH